MFGAERFPQGEPDGRRGAPPPSVLNGSRDCLDHASHKRIGDRSLALQSRRDSYYPALESQATEIAEVAWYSVVGELPKISVV